MNNSDVVFQQILITLYFAELPSPGIWHLNKTCRITASSLLWRLNVRYGVWNHQPHHCLLNLFGRRSKKILKLRVTGLMRGIHRWPVNSPGARMANNAENVSISWCHHIDSKIRRQQCSAIPQKKDPWCRALGCLWCQPGLAVAEAVDMPVIWYAMMLKWRHYEELNSRGQIITWLYLFKIWQVLCYTCAVH